MAANMTTATVVAGGAFQELLLAVRDVYSAEIYYQALPNLRFDQFTTRKDELTGQPGSVIRMPKMGGIKKGGPLQEGRRMETRAMTMSEKTIVVQEVGNAVAVTERLIQTAFYDTLTAASMLLGRDMALVLDIELRDSLKTIANKVYGGSATSRATLDVTSTFSTDTIYAATELLESNNSPKWGNDFYVCFAHSHQLTSLRKSPSWMNTQLYSNVNAIFFGEVGRWNDVRFISTSMCSNGKNATVDSTTGDFADPGYDPALKAQGVGNAFDVYQAYFFGEYTLGHATALPVELRDNGVADFGREHALAWYAIWGTGILEPLNAVIAETT